MSSPLFGWLMNRSASSTPRARRPRLERLEDRMAPAALAGPEATADRREVLVIDSQVADVQTLLRGLRPGTQLLRLSQTGDALEQIAQALTGPAQATDVHILSHAAPGVVQLGDSLLSAQTLAEHHQALADLASDLGPGSRLLLYGCSAGAGEAGL